MYKHGQIRLSIKSAIVTLVLLSMTMTGGVMALDINEPDYDLKLLGKYVFFDTSLSTPGNKQGCVSCHEPKDGWTFPDSDVNAGQVGNPGASPHANGHIKPPAASYAAFVPVFQPCNLGFPIFLGGVGHCGGLFWDGRAEGWGANYPAQLGPLGNGQVTDTVILNDLPADKQGAYKKYLGPLVDQALNPFQKGIEQNAGEKKVCQQVKTAEYKELYYKAFGEEIDCKTTPKDNPAYHRSFQLIVLATAAFEASNEFNPFNSRRDMALENDADGAFPLDDLTDEENLGHDLFYGETSDLNPTGVDAGCWNCHTDDPGNDDGTEPHQTYSDDAYHTIGIPFYREMRTANKGDIVGASDHIVDHPQPPGPRCLVLGCPTSPGFYKNPTLRNVDLRESPDFVKAYGHNGYFKSLWQIVHFYSTRDLKPDCAVTIPEIEDPTVEEALAADCWPDTEFPPDNNFGGVGILNLTEAQEKAIVAYLKTLSDTKVAEPPPPYKSGPAPKAKKKGKK